MAFTGWLALSIERDDQHESLCSLRAQLLWWRLSSDCTIVPTIHSLLMRAPRRQHVLERSSTSQTQSGQVPLVAPMSIPLGLKEGHRLSLSGVLTTSTPCDSRGIQEFSRPKLVIVQNVPRTGHLTFTSMVLWVIAAGSKERSPPRTRSRSGNEINSQFNQVIYFSGAPDCRTRRPMSVK